MRIFAASALFLLFLGTAIGDSVGVEGAPAPKKVAPSPPPALKQVAPSPPPAPKKPAAVPAPAPKKAAAAPAPTSPPPPEKQTAPTPQKKKVAFPPSLEHILPPQVHPPQLADVKHLLEKEINNWKPGKPAAANHDHVVPEHPKSFASKQKKLNEKGWFNYNGKVFEKKGGSGSAEAPKEIAPKATGTSPVANVGDAAVAAHHHVRHTLRGSYADRGHVSAGARQSSAIGSLIFIIVAGLAVTCAVGSLFTSP